MGCFVLGMTWISMSSATESAAQKVAIMISAFFIGIILVS
jgi:hypothetical protein